MTAHINPRSSGFGFSFLQILGTAFIALVLSGLVLSLALSASHSANVSVDTALHSAGGGFIAHAQGDGGGDSGGGDGGGGGDSGGGDGGGDSGGGGGDGGGDSGGSSGDGGGDGGGYYPPPQYDYCTLYPGLCTPRTIECTLQALPSQIPQGHSLTLRWTSTGATSASFDNGIGPVALNGDYFASNLSSSRTFTLTVSGPAGTRQCSVSITTIPPCPTGYSGTHPNCVPPPCPEHTTGTYPNCTPKTCPEHTTGTYPNCVPKTCPSTHTGTYPHCYPKTCPEHTTGTYPNCVPKTCPDTHTGTYPNCVPKTCPDTHTGTYPNCVPKTCPTGQVGTYPHCKTPCPSDMDGDYYPHCKPKTCPWGQTGTYPNCVPKTCPDTHTGTYPNCVPKTCPNGQTGTYPHCVPLQCPWGQTGTYPNCVPQQCPWGQTGTYPNCVPIQCPTGQTGTYPNCTPTQCPSGQTGTYPNCYPIQCPSGQTGTYPNCYPIQCPSGHTGTYPNCVTSQPPYCTISVSQNSIQQGQSVTLYWSSTNASYGFINPNVGSVGTNGSMQVWPQGNTTYTLTVVGTNGQTITCNTNVTVTQVYTQTPYCTLTSNPTYLTQGQSSTLSWTSQNAVNAQLSSAGSVGVNGAMQVWPQQSTTYTLTVWNAQGQQATCNAYIQMNHVTYVPPPTYYPPQPPTVYPPIQYYPPNIPVSKIPYTGESGPLASVILFSLIVAASISGAYLILYSRGGARQMLAQAGLLRA